MGGRKSQFPVERDILDGDRQAREALERRLQKKCDWEIPEDVSFYRHQQRLELRMVLLDKHVPDRICPGCKELKENPRQWAVNLKKREVICRSCLQRKHPMLAVDFNKAIVGDVIKRYPLDSDALTEARVSVGVSRREFARLAGWSPTYQSKLEAGEVVSVEAAMAKKLCDVLLQLGCRTLDKMLD